MNTNLFRRWVLRCIGIILFALANILVIDLVTNSVTEFQGVSWDFARYIDMAENGIRNNPNLIAPFAYRPLNPLLAGWMMRFFNFSSWKAFKLIAYMGAALNLVTLYWLIEKMGNKFRDILIVLEIICLQFFQIKFLLFDPFRPDHLVFSLINLAYLALMANLPILLAIIISLGLFVREFIVLPLAVYLADFIMNRRVKLVIPILVLLMSALVFVGIRRFIPVQANEAFLEINFSEKFLRSFVKILMDWKRNINIILCLAGYVLPLLMVFNPARWKNAWKESGRYHLWIIIHAVCVLVLTMIGGTDLGRFIVFLYLPLAILFASMLRSNEINPLELMVVLIGVIIFNRILWKVPAGSLETYIDFYGGYGSRINLQTGLRFLEIFGWITISQVIRYLLKAKVPTFLKK